LVLLVQICADARRGNFHHRAFVHYGLQRARTGACDWLYAAVLLPIMPRSRARQCLPNAGSTRATIALIWKGAKPA
jgi:hypothetical protein